MKRIVVIGYIFAVVTSAIFPAYGDTLCLGESAEVKIDLTTGTRTATASELIRYSVGWVDGAPSGAAAVVEVNGKLLSIVEGTGFVEWMPVSNGTYTLTHKVMSGDTQYGETLTATFLVDGVFPLAEKLCSGESASVKIDLTLGTRTTATTEQIRYSIDWETGVPSGAAAVVEVNGTMLNSVSGVGFVEWTPMSNGTYTLTHKVMLDETQYGEMLTATFVVTELPDASGATQTTEVPVPYAWLRIYDPGIVDEYSAYETAAKATAANGLKVWECYVAGTDPTNENSRFLARIEMRDDGPFVSWSPNLNTNVVVRSYTIWGKESLTDAAWHSPTNAADRFFKVSVEMP